jgi:hypothetical protein
MVIAIEPIRKYIFEKGEAGDEHRERAPDVSPRAGHRAREP